MRLVACQLDVGGLVWINPDHVTTVQRQSPGLVLVRFAAGQPQQTLKVMGEPQDLVARLTESAEVHDRRERAAQALEASGGLNLGDPRLDGRPRLRPE